MQVRVDPRTFAGIFAGAVGSLLVSIALLPVRDDMTNANVALVLVLVVIGATLIGGRWAGVWSAIVATLSFDFFYTQPYNSLTIASGDDLETTLLFMAVGVLVGGVLIRASSTRRAARRGHEDIEALHRVAEAAAHGAPIEEMIDLVEREVAAVLHLVACRYEPESLGPRLPQMDRSGSVPGGERRYTHDGFELPRVGCELPVIGRGKQLGRLVLIPTQGVGVSADERVVAVAISDQLGALLAS